MAYTKAQRLQIAHDFEEARALISARYETYICYALKRFRTRRAKRVIECRMGRPPRDLPITSYSLEDWLQYRCGVPRHHITATDMREYRLRWLDALIEEFSK